MALRDTVRRVGQIIGIFEEEPAPQDYYYDQDGYYDEPQDDGYMPYENTRSGYGATPRQPQQNDYRQPPRGQQAYDDGYYEAPPPQPAGRQAPSPQHYGQQQAQPVSIFGNNQRSKRPPDNVVNFARAPEDTGRKHSEIILCVRRLEDCQQIINDLLEGRSLFLNLEDMDDVQVQRVIDMLGGATFALRGTIAKISHRTYLVAPNSVDVVNNQTGTPPSPRGEFSAFRR